MHEETDKHRITWTCLTCSELFRHFDEIVEHVKIFHDEYVKSEPSLYILKSHECKNADIQQMIITIFSYIGNLIIRKQNFFTCEFDNEKPSKKAYTNTKKNINHPKKEYLVNIATR